MRGPHQVESQQQNNSSPSILTFLTLRKKCSGNWEYNPQATLFTELLSFALSSSAKAENSHP